MALPEKPPCPKAILPNPAKPPATTALRNASFGFCPPIIPPANVPIPVDKNKGIVGNKNGAAIGNTTGASFFTTFLIPLNNFLIKNSGCPVTGFIEFNSLPTI